MTAQRLKELDRVLARLCRTIGEPLEREQLTATEAETLLYLVAKAIRGEAREGTIGRWENKFLERRAFIAVGKPNLLPRENTESTKRAGGGL